jgi:hypothetical protein
MLNEAPNAQMTKKTGAGAVDTEATHTAVSGMEVPS